MILISISATHDSYPIHQWLTIDCQNYNTHPCTTATRLTYADLALQARGRHETPAQERRGHGRRAKEAAAVAGAAAAAAKSTEGGRAATTAAAVPGQQVPHDPRPR